MPITTFTKVYIKKEESSYRVYWEGPELIVRQSLRQGEKRPYQRAKRTFKLSQQLLDYYKEHSVSYNEEDVIKYKIGET